MDIENEWEKYSNGVGRKILLKYGYKKGKGLGKFENGIEEPIKVYKRPVERGGLSYEISSTKRQFVETPNISSTMEFAKSKIDRNDCNKEDEHFDPNPTIICEPSTICLPPPLDASPAQVEILDKQILQIKQLVKIMEEKYSTQPVTSFLPPFSEYTAGQAEAQIKKLSSVLLILQNLSETPPQELDFERVIELDKLIGDSIPDLYKNVSIDQYILFIVYPHFMHQLSIWNFEENRPVNPDDMEETDLCLAYLQAYRDQFISWRDFVSKKISFQNHHLWNNISLKISLIISDFVLNTSTFNIENTSKFLVKLLAMWVKVLPSCAVNIEHMIVDKIQREVIAIELKDVSKIYAWVEPWVHYLGIQEMESVLVVVYSKLEATLNQDLKINDFSVIQVLLPWKYTLTTYLYQKLLNLFIIPMLKKYLQQFEILPSKQELNMLWNILQWYDLFNENHTTLNIYINLLENEFFTKWLNILYLWLSNPKCNYEECALWYKGWRNFFKHTSSELYLHIYSNFNNAIILINVLLCVR
jgi:glycerol-3-phosphate responsive antiterminator